MKKIFLAISLFTSLIISNAQSEKALSVGMPFPNLEFENLVNYPNSKMKISDFKGKVIILDFFGTFCAPCVQELPKLDSIQRKMKDQVQFLIVCGEDKKAIANFYLRFKKVHDIQIPFITGDSMLSNLIYHTHVPFFAIIDPQGIIRAIPPPEEIAERNIALLFGGEKLNLEIVKDGKPRSEMQTPFVTDTTIAEGRALLYHSIITKYLENTSNGFAQKKFRDSSIKDRLTVTNGTISFLYQLAFGHFNKTGRNYFVPWSRVFLNVKDSSRFRVPKEADFKDWMKSNTYCYDLIIPAGFSGDGYEIMRSELNSMFPYTADIEKKKMKCVVIKRAPNANNLLTKGGEKRFEMTAEYINMRNTPWNELIFWLEDKFLYNIPIEDETGFTSNIDLDISADIDNPESLSAALRPAGLELTVEFREINMLVIRDKPSQSPL